MNYRRHIIVFFLTYFLLISCISSQPTRSRRQKRGLLKMMMHIVWDPVRLIRYWYAYDVTKEIAKSWRKIIPTILLLPVTQSNPYSHGFAKYVHPTFGLRDSDKKKIKHSGIPMVPFHQSTTVNKKPVALPSSAISHQSLPSQYSHPKVPLQYYNSNKLKSGSDKKNNLSHGFISHIPYEEDKNHNDYSVPHYFIDDNNSREEMSVSNFEFPNEDHRTEEDIRSLSSQKIPTNEYNENHKYPSIFQQNYLHYLTQEGSETDMVRTENAQNEEASPVFHPEQEFHIVLHPIPVNDFSPDSLKPLSNGEAVHYIPIHLRSNDSHEIDFSSLPLLFKAISPNSSVSEEVGLDQASSVEDLNTISAISNFSQENANASSNDAKTHVTWIPQKNENNTRRTDDKETELQSDESRKRTISVHRNYLENLKMNKDSTNNFSIHRNNINMERLREALKHGTPVLIPFNKSLYSTEIMTGNDNKNTVTFPKSNHQSKNPSVKTNQQVQQKESGVHGIHTKPSTEHSAERNSTHRLLLFLKKREDIQAISSK